MKHFEPLSPKVWRFGDICPGCHAPEVHFCPLCAADLFVTGHGAVPVGVPGARTLLSVCDNCIDRLNRGEVPPFYQPGGGSRSCE